MKKIYSKIIGLVCLIFLSAFSVNADEYKIGVVNQQAAIENALCGKKYQEYMQGEVDVRQDKLTAKKDLVKKKYEMLQRDKDILSKKDLVKKQKELETLQQDLQKMHEKFELELGNKDQEEHQKLAKLFNKAVANIGKSNKYDIIVPINIAFYSGNRVIDLTNDITKELDKIYKEESKKK